MTAGDTEVASSEREFSSVYHVYGPHRAGLPNLLTYFRELWRRRGFASEMSRAEMRGANANTFFGQAWLVINPLLMAGVYFILVTILNPGRGGLHPFTFFSHLTGALFAFTYVSTCMTAGSTAVVGAGKLLLNTAFPRLLMPLSAVRTAFFRFLPTVPVYLVFHILAGNPWKLPTIVCLYFLLCMTGFGMGLAALFATVQVYFRDTRSFLPYFIRLWMYLSPVLWTMDQLRSRGESITFLAHFNPMVPMLGGYSESLQAGTLPPASYFVISAAWALGAMIVGFLFFVSRERDFAVRVI
jgi:teichoic acid transport system permease protein